MSEMGPFRGGQKQTKDALELNNRPKVVSGSRLVERLEALRRRIGTRAVAEQQLDNVGVSPSGGESDRYDPIPRPPDVIALSMEPGDEVGVAVLGGQCEAHAIDGATAHLLRRRFELDFRKHV